MNTQLAFRAVLDALAHPTRPFAITGPAEPPAPLTSASAAIALTLCDEDTLVWLDRTFGDEVRQWFAFYTGAPITTDPAEAAFAFATGFELVPLLEELACGTHEQPHKSATVVLEAKGGQRLRATGPGINGQAEFDAPAGLLEMWSRNTDRFPMGVDYLLVDGGDVRGLPRTTILEGAA